MMLRSGQALLLFSLGFIFLLLSVKTSDAIPQGHLDYGGCLMCHAFHGGATGTPLLVALSTESICLSCHGEAADPNAPEASVHNPMGKLASEQGYITCRECHDAHEYDGTPNIKMVGYKCDPETQYGCDNGPIMTGTPPVIRFENSTTLLSSPVYCSVTFADNIAPDADFNIDGSFPGPGVCQICHSPNHNIGQNCTTCHPHAGGFLPSGGSCVGCHDGTDLDAPVVTYNSAHSKNTIFAITNPVEYDCVDCHNGHGAGTIEIPNNSAVGINYAKNGELGISLGSGSVAGDSEAEICWNCHNTYGVSEWGSNNNVNTGSSPYDYGDLYTGTTGSSKTSDWTNGVWRSGYGKTSSEPFWYKQASVSSTHAAQDSTGLNNTTRQGVDDISTIRCSYCHDVHDLNLRPGGLDTVTGKPYLRGAWMGNPYEEDGAPFWDASNDYAGAGNSNFENVPRGTPTPVAAKGKDPAVLNRLGGYWIDQNNVIPQSGALTSAAIEATFPTSSWLPEDFGGLCEMCHGNNDGTLSTFEIDNLNKYGVATGGSHVDWVSTYNGHANVVKGGGGNVSGTSSRNIFNARGGTSSLSDNPLMRYAGMPNPGNQGNANKYGFRGTNTTNGDTWMYNPQHTATQVLLQGTNNWGVDINGNGLDVSGSVTNDSYHQFSCSKCHNPHASRLPRLLITNCLDTKHNTWDQNYQVNASSGTANFGRTMSNWTSAQNCHRLVGDDPSTTIDDSPTGGYSPASHGAGWNTVSPW